MSGLRSIAGAGERDKVREEFRRLQASIQTILEAQTMYAQVTKAKYDALVKQGFTPMQALELCK